MQRWCGPGKLALPFHRCSHVLIDLHIQHCNSTCNRVWIVMQLHAAVQAVEKLVLSKLLVAGTNRRIHTVDRHAGVVSTPAYKAVQSWRTDNVACNSLQPLHMHQLRCMQLHAGRSRDASSTPQLLASTTA
jgi:hypothetical protein